MNSNKAVYMVNCVLIKFVLLSYQKPTSDMWSDMFQSYHLLVARLNTLLYPVLGLEVATSFGRL